MWIMFAVVVVAVVVIVLVGRHNGDEIDNTVDDIVEDGLVIDETLIGWTSIFEIAVVSRRELGKTAFGFEVRTEDRGLVEIEGRGGLGETFLSNSYRFAGFDHTALHETLIRRRARAVCYRR